jgi:pimeloyl-ACP methyl ester carboxylesterase
VRAGEVQLGWREWGRGDVTVVFIHGNLASKDWIELAAPLFPSGLRVIGIDWRGCGESDRPKPVADYSNCSNSPIALAECSRSIRSRRSACPSTPTKSAFSVR